MKLSESRKKKESHLHDNNAVGNNTVSDEKDNDLNSRERLERETLQKVCTSDISQIIDEKIEDSRLRRGEHPH